MNKTRYLSRRRLLSRWSVIPLAALAGCADSGQESRPGEDGQDTTDEATTGTRDTSDTSTSDGLGTDSTSDAETTDSAGTDDLDLREANVVDVSFEEQNGTYTFDVTLHHDDDGEEGYANWWQVERLDGTRLGRRELLHAHSQQPFTRSETIEIPEDVTCVVVRGHDQIHEYGGLAIVVNLDSGETGLRDQGSERQSFDDSDCPG
ncbi:hypothetical protein ACFQE8_23070 [Salinirubellus sp. GCM10025818]|uniref:hypothetical protein n=1 Tax=Salinirubellus TaxID=2162630 RepID=UPI0030CA9630